jgi:hypothetical protein
MYFSSNSWTEKPDWYDALPTRQSTSDYVIGQRYRCEERPRYVFTYWGTDDDASPLDRLFSNRRNGLQALDRWQVESYAACG